MKRTLSLFISIFLSFALLVPAFASESEQIRQKDNAETKTVSSYTEYFDDGGYAEIVIISETNNILEKSGTSSILSSAYYQNGSKIYRQYDSNGQLLFRFILNATFLIQPGVYVTCVNSSYSHNIYDSTWSLSSASSYITNDRAVGNATFIKRFLFVPIMTQHVEILVRCTVNGVIY